MVHHALKTRSLKHRRHWRRPSAELKDKEFTKNNRAKNNNNDGNNFFLYMYLGTFLCMYLGVVVVVPVVVVVEPVEMVADGVDCVVVVAAVRSPCPAGGGCQGLGNGEVFSVPTWETGASPVPACWPPSNAEKGLFWAFWN